MTSEEFFIHIRSFENFLLSLERRFLKIKLTDCYESRNPQILAEHGRAFSRSQIAGLLKSESGKSSLNLMKRWAVDYWIIPRFTLKDFEDIGLSLEDIRFSNATVSKTKPIDASD